MKKMLAVALLCIVATPAFATKPISSGNSNSLLGVTTSNSNANTSSNANANNNALNSTNNNAIHSANNNVSTNLNNVDARVTSSNANNNTAHGGAGGAGGSAVQGQLQGQMQGQAIVGSGNSSIAAGAVQTSNLNTSVSAGGSSSVRDSGNSQATGGTSRATGGTSSVHDSGNSSSASAGGHAAIGEGANSADNSSTNNVTVEGDNWEAPKIPVATAYAPNLTASEDTCMGSTSAGGQGITFGLSFGTTWQDKDCVRRKDARFLHSAGHNVIALSLMCSNKAVLKAVETAGTSEQKLACGIK